MPISGCHDLPLATFNLPSRNNLQNKPNSAPQKNKKLKPLVQPLLRRHAWLAAPAANTCSRNKPSKQTATASRQNKKTNPLVPSSPAAAVARQHTDESRISEPLILLFFYPPCGNKHIIPIICNSPSAYV